MGYGNPLKIASDYWRKKKPAPQPAEKSGFKNANKQLDSAFERPAAKAAPAKKAAPAGKDAPLSAARIARNKRLMGR